MRIVEIRESALPLSANIQNSVVNFSEHTVSLVAVMSDVMRNGRPVVGVAFDSIGRYAQSGLMRERFIRRLMAAKPDELLDETGKAFDTDKAFRVMMRNEKPGGHGDRAHAVAALELALWDLNAKLNDEPAWKTIARHFGVKPSERMPVYAAGGYYYPEDNLGRLQDEMRRYRDMGYEKFKMKIGGAPLREDIGRIEAALKLVGQAEDLAVDANGRFDVKAALDYGEAMTGFGLRWYEEPGDPLDYHLMSELAAVYPHRLATGENLFSCHDVDNLALFGGMRRGKDLFQMDPALSYGLGEFHRMIRSLEAKGFSRSDVHPHGGHMIAVHIVVGLGLGGSEAYPGVFAPVGGYAEECVVGGGGVTPGASPGFGLEAKADLAPHIKALLA
ncbi:enolase C-terminal domain-like protein [Mesorhizobium sp. IMUNJ 23232]|uniref:enolase C-terminal domain-like protein n=1 Tax=Mesorhizobium sp. IMUNJ 23232 TaxID=3376064 RepID=UPI0037B36441